MTWCIDAGAELGSCRLLTRAGMLLLLSLWSHIQWLIPWSTTHTSRKVGVVVCQQQSHRIGGNEAFLYILNLEIRWRIRMGMRENWGDSVHMTAADIVQDLGVGGKQSKPKVDSALHLIMLGPFREKSVQHGVNSPRSVDLICKGSEHL